MKNYITDISYLEAFNELKQIIFLSTAKIYKKVTTYLNIDDVLLYLSIWGCRNA